MLAPSRLTACARWNCTSHDAGAPHQLDPKAKAARVDTLRVLNANPRGPSAHLSAWRRRLKPRGRMQRQRLPLARRVRADSGSPLKLEPMLSLKRCKSALLQARRVLPCRGSLLCAPGNERHLEGCLDPDVQQPLRGYAGRAWRL